MQSNIKIIIKTTRLNMKFIKIKDEQAKGYTWVNTAHIILLTITKVLTYKR